MSTYIVKAAKLVTVSNQGTLYNGAIVIEQGKIVDIGPWEKLKAKYDKQLEIIDYGNLTITPGLVDCHTHLLEFAPSSLYPVTKETHNLAAKAILLKTLASGITALGEQICGSPMLHSEINEVKQSVIGFPLDISFATTSISIGLEPMQHFTSVTGSIAVERDVLVQHKIIMSIAQNSEYPGENIFINATPANFTRDLIPNAGQIIYSQDELNEIVSVFHSLNRKIGTHVAGKQGIDMALHARFDVLHHAHGIMEEQIQQAANQKTMIVATPLGGTHLQPNTVEEVLKMINSRITVAISSDGYLPPHDHTVTFPKLMQGLIGPDSLMNIANPYMKELLEHGYDENDALALITLNGAKILGKNQQFGSLEVGKDANFLVAEGTPGLDIVDIEQIKAVYFRGEKMIQR